MNKPVTVTTERVDDIPLLFAQLKRMLATLDPLGLPIASEIVPGNSADDPLYEPAVHRVRQTFETNGLLYQKSSKL